MSDAKRLIERFWHLLSPVPPPCFGIYFLLTDREDEDTEYWFVEYIGISQDVTKRVEQHRHEGKIKFDGAVYIPLSDENQAGMLESDLIRAFCSVGQAPHNIQYAQTSDSAPSFDGICALIRIHDSHWYVRNSDTANIRESWPRRITKTDGTKHWYWEKTVRGKRHRGGCPCYEDGPIDRREAKRRYFAWLVKIQAA